MLAYWAVSVQYTCENLFFTALSLFISVLSGGYAILLFEDPAEIRGTCITALLGDVLNGKIGFSQQLSSVFEAYVV